MIGILKRTFAKTAEATSGDDDHIRWIVIAIVGWAEAEIMRSKLESEGIPCVLQREAVGVVYGITIGPMGDVRVLVPEPLVERAIDLLSEGELDVVDDDSSQEDAQEGTTDI